MKVELERVQGMLADYESLGSYDRLAATLSFWEADQMTKELALPE